MPSREKQFLFSAFALQRPWFVIGEGAENAAKRLFFLRGTSIESTKTMINHIRLYIYCMYRIVYIYTCVFLCNLNQ